MSGARLRLALFCDRFPELSETFVSGEVLELRRQGVDVTVYSGPARVRDPHWNDDVPVQRLATPVERRLRRLEPVVRLASRHPAETLRDVRRRGVWRQAEAVNPLRRLAPALERLGRERPDHIHVHFAAGAALDALRAGAFTGIPYSVTAHAHDIFENPANLREKLDLAAFVTVPCRYNLTELARAGVRADRIHVRMLGTNTRQFARTLPYPRKGCTLAVGRLIEKKGFHVLIDAAARRDIGPVRIVGDGPWRRRLEDQIAAHDLQQRVILAGAASPDRIRQWMEAATLLVVPSIVTANGDRDALPVVIWEALAMELPVVGTTVAGLPEVIRPPWGRTVEPGDPDQLADAIAASRDGPHEQRLSAGQAGRQWLERNHRQELAVGQLIERIERV